MNKVPSRMAVHPAAAAIAVERPYRVADPHGAPRGEAEWHHERHRRDVEGDLVGGGSHWRQLAGKGGRRRENADFERHR